MPLSETRRAINRHLHRMHGGVKGEGSTTDRLVEHDVLHTHGIDGYAGLPLHRHPLETADAKDIIEYEALK